VLLEELLDAVSRELVMQVDVKAYADRLLARATAAGRRGARRSRPLHEELVRSGHGASCDE